MSARPFVVRDLGEIAIRCQALGPMVDFYRDVIGLAPMGAPRDGMAFFRIAPGHDGHTRVLALFRDDGAPPPVAGAGSSLHHLALNVDFAAQEAAVAWFVALGLEPRVEVFDWVGWRGVFVRDPEGNSVELVAHDAGLGAGR